MSKKQKCYIGIVVAAAVLIYVALPAGLFSVMVGCGYIPASKLLAGVGMITFGACSGCLYGPLAIPYYMFVLSVIENIG